MNYSLQKNILISCLGGLLTILYSCASISSEIVKCENSDHKECDLDDGVVYYMPTRSIRLNIEVKSDKNTVSNKIEKVKKTEIIKKTGKEPDSNTVTKTNTTTTTTESTDTVPKEPESTEKAITVKLTDNYATETMPDLSQQFLLRYRKNWVGKNHMAINVNRTGLLSVTHADTISRVNQIANNIAIDVATASLGFGFAPSAPSTQDSPITPKIDLTPGTSTAMSEYSVTVNARTSCADGTYTLLVDPKSIDPISNKKIIDKTCGVNIEIERVARKQGRSYRLDSYHWDDLYDRAKSFITNHNLNGLPGLFYKQDLPYIVTISNSESKSQFIAFSPNESGTYFAPITKTFFTDNTSDISLVNGVINTLHETTDSELLALSKIPSEVLGSYTDSLGKTFGQLGATIKTQNDNLGLEMSLFQSLTKIKQCQVAIATNNLSGKTGDDLNKALSNIQTACAN